jgi:hypothetical protein
MYRSREALSKPAAFDAKTDAKSRGQQRHLGNTLEII